MNFQEQLRYNLERGPYFEADDVQIQLPAKAPVNLIAYYLPQFHPIPENDQWWGEGFTEWTNVTKSMPQFEGHYQPHLPGPLGFYDLRLVDNMTRQWEMAERHGIGGFCFHYYWFSGKRVLELPLENLRKNPNLPIPFCINWANENWTRTWDGSEREILLGHSYSDADDLAFIDSLVPFVEDPRYIRVDGRPLIMIYRPSLLSDPARAVRVWRERFKSMGLADPYFVMPQTYGIDDPRPLGFDAVAGFPPHKFGPQIRSETVKTRPYNDLFAAEVLNYERLAQAASEFDPTDYTMFHGVCPEWDNAARRPNRGLIFTGSSPSLYGQWLANACAKVMRRNRPQERIVFINAWNEWAEGAHLEPDRHNGFAYLRETARVLARAATYADQASLNAPGVQPSRAPSIVGRQADRRRTLVRRARNKLASFAEGAARVLRPG